MGWPMAANLVNSGFEVTVFDIASERRARFAAEIGGHAASDAGEAVAGADAVVTILPTSREVADAVAAMKPRLERGAIVIEMSSGVPSVTRALATGLDAIGAMMIDCPVSGGVPRARTGELAILAGGETEAIDRAEPVLRAMGSSIHRCGGIGAGQAMKALNNLVSAGGFLIGIEALLIGRKFGLDPALMVDVLNASTGMNNSTQRKFRQFVLSRTLRLRIRPRPDGEGPLDRARDRPRCGDADAVRRALPGDVGERRRAARPGSGPHRDGAAQ